MSPWDVSRWDVAAWDVSPWDRTCTNAMRIWLRALTSTGPLSPRRAPTVSMMAPSRRSPVSPRFSGWDGTDGSPPARTGPWRGWRRPGRRTLASADGLRDLARSPPRPRPRRVPRVRRALLRRSRRRSLIAVGSRQGVPPVSTSCSSQLTYPRTTEEAGREVSPCHQRVLRVDVGAESHTSARTPAFVGVRIREWRSDCTGVSSHSHRSR